MKKIFFLVFIIYQLCSIAQQDSLSNRILFNEFGFSLNYSKLSNNNNYNSNSSRFGYGVSVYHAGLKNKHVNLIFGLEFNSVKFHIDRLYNGHFSHYKDLLISINSLSLPLLCRAEFGNKHKVFIETGIRADAHPWTNMKGICVSYSPNSNYSETKISEPAALEGMSYFDLIPSIGFGLNYHYKSSAILFKVDYRYGIFPLYEYMDKFNNRYFNLSICYRKLK